jgi:hypothetical protein
VSKKTRIEPSPDRKVGKAADSGGAKPQPKKRRARKPSWLGRQVRALVWFLFRMGLRVGLGLFLLLAGATGYYYLKLPDLFSPILYWYGLLWKISGFAS